MSPLLPGWGLYYLDNDALFASPTLPHYHNPHELRVKSNPRGSLFHGVDPPAERVDLCEKTIVIFPGIK
jgi:hypothetical protein